MGTILPVSNPEWIPSRDFLLPLLTDLLGFHSMSYHWSGGVHIPLSSMIVQVNQWESLLRVRFGVVHRLDSSPSVVMMLPVSNPEWIPSRDSLLAPLTDLFDFLFMLHHQEGASHILLICLIVQVSQWESPLQVRFDFGSSSRFVAGRGYDTSSV